MRRRNDARPPRSPAAPCTLVCRLAAGFSACLPFVPETQLRPADPEAAAPDEGRRGRRLFAIAAVAYCAAVCNACMLQWSWLAQAAGLSRPHSVLGRTHLLLIGSVAACTTLALTRGAAHRGSAHRGSAPPASPWRAVRPALFCHGVLDLGLALLDLGISRRLRTGSFWGGSFLYGDYLGDGGPALAVIGGAQILCSVLYTPANRQRICRASPACARGCAAPAIQRGLSRAGGAWA